MLIHPSELASLIGGVVTLAGVVVTVIQLLRKSGRFNLTPCSDLAWPRSSRVGRDFAGCWC